LATIGEIIAGIVILAALLVGIVIIAYALSVMSSSDPLTMFLGAIGGPGLIVVGSTLIIASVGAAVKMILYSRR